MRLETSMNTGREALLVNGTALNTVADNLANSNTTGFKDTRLEFGDLIADGGNSLYGGPLQGGNGVVAGKVTIQHSQQGTVDRTARPLDAAIDGRGWFVLNDGTNQYYSRAGNFSTNEDGEIIGQGGAKLLGYTALSPDTAVPIKVKDLVGTPTASAKVTIGGNLSSNAVIAQPPAAATFQALEQNAGFSTAAEVIDSLGNTHNVSLYFYKTAQQTWTSQAYVDAGDTGGVPGTPVLVGTGVLNFDQNGNLVEGGNTELNITPPWAQAAAGNVNIDLSGFTGNAGSSSVANLTSDGQRGGNLKQISIDQSGNVVALLESGETINAAQIAIADFISPDGLERIGDNLFQETELSGEAEIAKPTLTKILGGALESSTVDTAREFTTLIQYQQGYRASSQIIQSISELIKSTIQIA